MAGPDAAQNHDQPVMVQPHRAQLFGHTAAGGQQVRKRFAPQGDLHPLDLGEIAEADLTRLVGQRDHQLWRWAMQRLPVLIWLFLLQVLQQRLSHLGQRVWTRPATGFGGSSFGQGQRTLLSSEGSGHDPVPCTWQPDSADHIQSGQPVWRDPFQPD